MGFEQFKAWLFSFTRPIWKAEYTNPPTADVDAFVTARATAATAQSISGAALNGVVGAAALGYPRNITFTLSNHADFDAGTATVVGTDVDGNAITEDFTIPDGGNATVTGAKAFLKVTSISFPAGAGTGGSFEIGFGAKLGLPKKAKVVAGAAVGVVAEIAVGAQVTNGTFVVPATGAPYGTYAPNSAPDATRDYCVYYERDYS